MSWDEAAFEAQAIGLYGALRFRFERRDGDTRSETRLFGIARTIGRHGERVRPGGARRRARSKHRSRSPGEATSKRRKAPSINLSVLRRMWPDVQWLVTMARRRLQLKLRGDLVYGFPDPFATGMVHGLTAALQPFPELGLRPDYAQGVLHGWVELSLRLYPLQAVLLFVQTSLRPGVRSLWWPRVRNRLRIIPRRTKEAVST